MNEIQEKDAINAFLSINDARVFIEVAMQHYQEQMVPGWFTLWIERLYNTLEEGWGSVTLDELSILSSLFTENVWTSPALAMNRVYDLYERLGRDTTGMRDYTYYSCSKDDGFIYMFRRGGVVRRPKRLYGEQIERELTSMNSVHGYIPISQEMFERLTEGLPIRIDE